MCHDCITRLVLPLPYLSRNHRTSTRDFIISYFIKKRKERITQYCIWSFKLTSLTNSSRPRSCLLNPLLAMISFSTTTYIVVFNKISTTSYDQFWHISQHKLSGGRIWNKKFHKLQTCVAIPAWSVAGTHNALKPDILFQRIIVSCISQSKL